MLQNVTFETMKKVILSLVAIISFAVANAQFTVWADHDFAYGPSSEFELVTHAFVKNTSGSSVDYVWQMQRINFPTGWAAALCDKNICHDTGVYTAQFTLAAGDSGILDVHTYPDSVGGNGSIKVTVYPVGNPGASQSDTFGFNAWALSAKNVSRQNEVEFYPNPTTSQLNINFATDKPVTFQVCNILGQVKLQHTHVGKLTTIDVSELPTGIYFLGYTNDKGQLVYKKFKKIQ